MLIELSGDVSCWLSYKLSVTSYHYVWELFNFWSMVNWQLNWIPVGRKFSAESYVQNLCVKRTCKLITNTSKILSLYLFICLLRLSNFDNPKYFLFGHFLSINEFDFLMIQQLTMQGMENTSILHFSFRLNIIIVDVFNCITNL